MGIFFCLVILADLKEPAKVLPFFIFILSGVVFYDARRRYLLKKGVDVEKAIKNNDWIGQ